MVPVDAERAKPLDTHLIGALAAGNESTRLKAALAIGSNPDPDLVDTLVARCAIEPDFYVRDMLTCVDPFPLGDHCPRLHAELRSESPQARSQALHTLSKIKDAGAWPAITRSLLRDSNDEVARSAWRAAVALVPDGQEKDPSSVAVLLCLPARRTSETGVNDHNPPLLWRSGDGSIEELAAGGTVIGIFAQSSYEESNVQVKSGDVLIAFTDGVSEAHNPMEEEFGEERLKQALRRFAHLPVSEITSKILEELKLWMADAEQFDDLTFLFVKVR